MTAEASNSKRWRLGIFTALIMTLLSLFPQLDLCRRRGSEWQGAYTYAHYDEDIYAAYLNGLIGGRPRRSDPLVEPQDGRAPPESLFSIQFVTPYFLATLARSTGLTAAQIYIAMPPLMAMFTMLLFFYLLVHLTNDERLSACGALFILCFGTLAGRDGKIIHLLHGQVWYAGFPFLRRYQPGPSFLLFFLFSLFIWWGFTQRGRRGGLAAMAAGMTFGLLVFSYFYLWTAAAAWLLIIVALWMIARPAEARQVLWRLLPMAVIGTGTLAGYWFLLSGIAGNTGPSQALEYSRAPDLLRGPEIIGAVVLAALIMTVKRKQISWRDPLTLLACSFAVLPFVLFNQQLLTGVSLQPFHYEIFISNYTVLMAAVIALAVYRRHALAPWRPLPWQVFFCLCFFSLIWGITEIRYSAIRERERNLARDGFVPVARRLNELALRNPGEREVVFTHDTYVVADNTAGYAPQSLLWATHMVFMPSLNAQQRQTRFFQYLYYGGVTPGELEKRLKGNSFVEISALFGYERYTRHLTAEFRPLNDNEVRRKIREYADFVQAFDDALATHPVLSYVIVPAASQPDFSQLDRWYVREPVERVDEYLLFRVKLRINP